MHNKQICIWSSTGNKSGIRKLALKKYNLPNWKGPVNRGGIKPPHNLPPTNCPIADRDPQTATSNPNKKLQLKRIFNRRLSQGYLNADI